MPHLSSKCAAHGLCFITINMSSGAQTDQQQTYVGAAVNGVSSGASYTYDTVASTASYTYTQAANLVGSVTGNTTAPTAEKPSTVDAPEAASTESALPQHPHQEEKERGPSSSDRVGKSQQEIGTEYDIPTSAGLGTTCACDDDIKPAADKEASQHKAKAAAVGQDYANQPCPDKSASKAPAPAADSTAHSEENDDTPGSASHGGLGKLKNKVKGEAKVVAGKLQKDDDKVQLGKSIKAGTA